jgi:hypothetical protein
MMSGLSCPTTKMAISCDLAAEGDWERASEMTSFESSLSQKVAIFALPESRAALDSPDHTPSATLRASSLP